MNELFSNPLFTISICIVCYYIGTILKNKYNHPLINPLLIGIILVTALLLIFGVDYATFEEGSEFITLFLPVVTCILGVTIYRRLSLIKKNLIPILVGTTFGSIVSILSIYFLCDIFNISEKITASLLPKSVTSPIAMEISKNLGGIPSITVICVIYTGIIGAIFIPMMMKVLKMKDEVSVGVGIGTSSHAVGTSKAVEMGEIYGGVSSIAICFSGLITGIIAIFL